MSSLRLVKNMAKKKEEEEDMMRGIMGVQENMEKKETAVAKKKKKKKKKERSRIDRWLHYCEASFVGHDFEFAKDEKDVYEEGEEEEEGGVEGNDETHVVVGDDDDDCEGGDQVKTAKSSSSMKKETDADLTEKESKIKGSKGERRLRQNAKMRGGGSREASLRVKRKQRRKRMDSFIRVGLYAQLTSGNNCRWDPQIRRDVGRTFPEQKLFSSVDGVGQRQIFDILHAFAQYAPDVGYCQGMNFIAGFLLLQAHKDSQKENAQWLGDLAVEEAVFWLLVGLMRAPKYSMDGLFSEGLPRLFTATYQVNRSVTRLAPNVRRHLERYDVQMMTFLPQWFFSVFTTHMRPESEGILVVWDALFRDGWNAIVRVAVGILVGSKSAILSRKSHDECATYLCGTIFQRDDIARMTRAGSVARQAISDARLDAYAQEMLGIECQNGCGGTSGALSDIRGVRGDETGDDSWLAWSRDVSSHVADVASESFRQILPDTMLQAIGSSSPAEIKNRFSSSVYSSFGSAARTIRAVQCALSRKAREKLERAIAELAPLHRSAGTILSIKAEDDLSTPGPRGPLVEIHFGKECAHVPISACGSLSNKTKTAVSAMGPKTLDLCRLRQLILLSFPALCGEDEEFEEEEDKFDGAIDDRDATALAGRDRSREMSFSIRCRVRGRDDTLKWIVATSDEDVAWAIETGMSVREKSVAAISASQGVDSEELKVASDVDVGGDVVVVSSARCVAIFEVVTAKEMARQRRLLSHIEHHKSRLFRGQLKAFRRKVEAVYKMVSDRSAAFWPKVLAMSALVYVVSPLDAIPDAIPVVGLADDFAVLTALFASFASMSIDLEKYEEGCENSGGMELTTHEVSGGESRASAADGKVNRDGDDEEECNEIDSDFDIDDFHDCDIDDDYVEIEDEKRD